MRERSNPIRRLASSIVAGVALLVSVGCFQDPEILEAPPCLSLQVFDLQIPAEVPLGANWSAHYVVGSLPDEIASGAFTDDYQRRHRLEHALSATGPFEVVLPGAQVTNLATHTADWTLTGDDIAPGEILPPGSYVLTASLVGYTSCEGPSPEVSGAFQVVATSGCSFAGVERLDLEVADLTFAPGLEGGVSWTVNYLVQTDGGPPPAQPTATLIERLTVINVATGAQLFLGERTGVTGEMTPGGSVQHLWPLTQIDLDPPPGDDEVAIRLEILAAEPGRECGPGNLSSNNSQEVIHPN